MAPPLTYPNHERLYLEICWRLPFSEYLKYPLLGIFVLCRRALRAFEPADHVLHWHVPLLSMCFILSSFLVMSNKSYLQCHWLPRRGSEYYHRSILLMEQLTSFK